MAEPIQHASLAAALAAAQGEFPEVKKTRTATITSRKEGGEPYTYKYADLADVMAAIRPVLARHGIAVLQPIITGNGGETLLRTELRFGDQRETSDMPLPIGNLAPQAIGSLLTYYRRYALTAMLGIAADEDDDAQAVNDDVRHHRQPQTNRQPPCTAARQEGRFHPRRQTRPPHPSRSPAERVDAALAAQNERDPLGIAGMDERTAFSTLRRTLIHAGAAEADHLLVLYRDRIAGMPEAGRKALQAVVAGKIEHQAAE